MVVGAANSSFAFWNFSKEKPLKISVHGWLNLWEYRGADDCTQQWMAQGLLTAWHRCFDFC